MNVLLVEDNDGDADLVADAFNEAKSLGDELARVLRLSAALEALGARRFDVVLLDLSLPDATGLEGLLQIRASAPTVPIVVLTGLSDAAVGVTAIQHGAQDYLQKGLVPGTELVRALKYARERAQFVHRAEVLSEASAAMVGSQSAEGVLGALRKVLSKRYVERFEADGGGPEHSVDELTLSERPSQVAGQLFSSLTPVMSSAHAERLTGLLADGMSSAMIVPFHVRGWVEGMLTFARSMRSESFVAADLALAEELVRRTVAAIEYAELLVVAQRERERAEVAGRARDEFLATLSHELRTPLNAILGWTVLLRGGTVDPASVPKALETIERNARSQAALIEDIFEVSRIITGKIRLEFRQVDVFEVLSSAIESISPAVQSKSLIVRVTGDREAGSVLADADRLLQIFWNLLSNAVKFTPSGGQVSVQLRRSDDYVEVIVADSGQGISPELIPHVFQRFRQGDSTTTRAHGGLGLGLAIVRHLVELQGGTVTAESEGVGKGATFTVRLALAAPRQPEQPEPQPLLQ